MTSCTVKVPKKHKVSFPYKKVKVYRNHIVIHVNIPYKEVLLLWPDAVLLKAHGVPVPRDVIIAKSRRKRSSFSRAQDIVLLELGFDWHESQDKFLDKINKS